MLIQSSLKYIYILIFSLLFSVVVKAQYADTAVRDTSKVEIKKADSTKHQLTLGVDIFHPILFSSNGDKVGYEFMAEYYLKNELYLVAEGGWGSSKVAYDDLKYTSNNTFGRIGFNKVLLPRDKPSDWGGMFMGLRLGATSIERSSAQYTVVDSVWGSTGGIVPSKNFMGYWLEITGGVRVELYKGIMAGWNIRGKFLLNNSEFKDLAPLYVSGYGKGDKNAIFDFNFYLAYAIRWKRHY